MFSKGLIFHAFTLLLLEKTVFPLLPAGFFCSNIPLPCYQVKNGVYAYLTVFEQDFVTLVIVLFIKKRFLANISTPYLSVPLWICPLLPFPPSLMRWHDWQQWRGHITSHLVSSAATCAPQCHRAALCLQGPPAFHLSALKAPTPSGTFCPESDVASAQLGHIWKRPQWQGKCTMAMMSAVKWKTAIHLKGFIYIFCSRKLICVWFKICWRALQFNQLFSGAENKYIEKSLHTVVLV